MLTKQALEKLGADTAGGIERCMGDENFYLNLVGKVLEQDDFEQLKAAVEEGDLDTAFDRAHALKGAYGNLSLTNLYDRVAAVTEELRSRNDIDYSGYMREIDEMLEQYRALL
jgi:HPt (histidine-containing phosphotransfer) domain-containing protein